LDIRAKQWIVAEVGSQAGEIVSIGKEIVIAMDNVHIPAHEMHLQAKDGRVVAIVGQNELYRITVSNPKKPLTKARVSTFVYGPVARKAFA
jgi:hypothetical protein